MSQPSRSLPAGILLSSWYAVGTVSALLVSWSWFWFLYRVTAFYMKKILRPSGVLKKSNACHRGHMSKRSTLLRVGPKIIAKIHIIIWHRHAISLVLNTRVQRGRVPLGGIAGTVHRKCSLKTSIVTLETNAIHRRKPTAGTQHGGRGTLALSCSREYDCGVISGPGCAFRL